jgi:hypothetical protein
LKDLLANGCRQFAIYGVSGVKKEKKLFFALVTLNEVKLLQRAVENYSDDALNV